MSQGPQYVLVFDVGGSHISAALCASVDYQLVGVARAPLPADGLSSVSLDPSGPAFRFVRLIHALSERVVKSAGVPWALVAGAALAMPGPFDYQNGVSQIRHKLQSLYGVDLKVAIAGRFNWQPSQVGFVNDAAAFLLGEAGAGAARGFARSIGITLGTGIGCAFAINSRIAMPMDPFNGAQSNDGQSNATGSHSNGVPPGGEIWNLPYNGATVEDFVSTRYLRSQYQSSTGLDADVSEVAAIAQCRDDQPCTALDETLARQTIPVPAKSIAPLRGASNSARRAFLDFGRHLAFALNQHTAAFHPDIIVLGGGISRASALFLPATRKALSFPTTISISVLMDEAPLVGAGVDWFTSR